MDLYAGRVGKFLLVVVVAAVLIYLTVRVIERRGIRRRPKPTPPRPMGPDDDPDFLWDLDKKKRHKKPPLPDDHDEPGEPGDEAQPA